MDKFHKLSLVPSEKSLTDTNVSANENKMKGQQKHTVTTATRVAAAVAALMATMNSVYAFAQ